MGAIKNYMMNLADKIGKDYDQVTNQDMEIDLFNQAQEAFSNGFYSKEEFEKMKSFLPTINSNELPTAKLGDIYMDNSGIYYLIVA